MPPDNSGIPATGLYWTRHSGHADEKNEAIAVRLVDLSQRLDNGEPSEKLRRWVETTVLEPLGIQVPVREENAT